MLNKIINFSLHNRLLIIVIAVLLSATGIYTASRMEVDVFPDLNAPTVVVMTEAPGMATEEVERTVTFVIETALNGATDVRRVRSSSTNGFSVVWVEFDWDTDIYVARQIVSEKLATVGEQLPKTAGQPILGPQSSILGEILIVGLTSDSLSMQDLRTIADWTIRPRLLSTGGVAQVSVIGGDLKEYQIQLSTERMRRYGVSLPEILNAARDMNLNASGGVIYEYGNEYVVRGMVADRDVDEIAKGFIKLSETGKPIVLSDVADVVIGGKSPKLGVASERGCPAVLITVTKQPSTNTMELTEQLDQTLEELQKTLPDVHISTDIFRQSRFIESSIDNISKSLWEGAIFVVIVLFFFLMNGRVTIISLVALPLSLLTAILTLKGLGFTINTMSLGGMAIAIGSLVDDAIIDVENVYKRLRENYALPKNERRPALQVVYDASREIRTSIVHATIITIVAFIPLFFLGGMEGRMLQPLGISFIVSLFASMIVAVTLTPVMCSYMLTSDKTLRKHTKEAPVSRFLKKIYGRALQGTLRHGRIVIGGAIALFIGAVALYTTLGSSFLPPFNEGSLTINVSTLPGVSLEESDKIGRMVEEMLLEIPEIQTVARKTGRAELDEHALGVNASEIEAPFVLDERSRDEFLADIRSRLGTIKGIDLEIGQPISHRIDAMLSGTQANIAIKLFGEDLNKMYSLGQEIKQAIADVDGITDVMVEQQVERAQLQIIPRREMLARYGITLADFSQWISVALEGETVSQIYDGNATFDLTVKVGDGHNRTIEETGDLLVDTGNGGKVPLSHIADIVSTSGPNAVNRENVKRKIVVSANITGGDLGGAVEAIKSAIDANIDLPQGYYIEYGGQFESQQSAARTLSFTSAIALLIIFLLLFQEFKSLSLSGMIMINLPLALIGGVAAIAMTSGIVSIPAVIGFISLLGIAVRNGILLVSHYGQLRNEGITLKESIIQGSLDRLNPILMTSLSSALALIPLALGGDISGNEIQSPMAKVILGGLISSTLLNIFVIPTVYLFLNSKKNLMRKLFIISIILFGSLHHTPAQNIDGVLYNIEQNNVSLRAQKSLGKAQRLEIRAGNMPEGPEVEYMHSWQKNSSETVSEINVTQGFDFPTAYFARRKAAITKEEQLGHELNTFRQDLLLKAKLLCIDIIALRQEYALLKIRTENTRRMATSMDRALKEGEVTSLEKNRADIELANMQNQCGLKKIELESALEQLQNLNGGNPIEFNDSLFALPEEVIPFESMKKEYETRAPQLLSLLSEKKGAEADLKVSRAGALPGITVGYHHEIGTGEKLNGVIVGISLPLWKSRREIKRAKAQIEYADARLEDERINRESTLKELYGKYTTLKTTLEQFIRIDLQQEPAMRYITEAYRTGILNETDFLSEVNALYEVKSQRIAIERDLHKVIAEINALNL